MSEVAIVAGIAKATLPPNPKVKWVDWVSDYGQIRNLIAETYPDQFHDFNARLWTPGGFYRGNSARERIWKTKSGRAEFTSPEFLSATGFEDAPGRFRLITMRSIDQFNTTIYGYSDRMRGIEGARDVLLTNPDDMQRANLSEGQIVSLLSDAGDGVERRIDGLKVTPFSLPDGCVGGYYPEMNPLMPLWRHDERSKTRAKSPATPSQSPSRRRKRRSLPAQGRGDRAVEDRRHCNWLRSVYIDDISVYTSVGARDAASHQRRRRDRGGPAARADPEIDTDRSSSRRLRGSSPA